MVTPVFKTDFSSLEKTLGTYKRQIPYAASRAINETLRLGKEKQSKETQRIFEGGATRFTRQGFLYSRSTKTRLRGALYIPANRMHYMGLNIDGGTLTPRGKALVQPVNQRINRYGNMSRNAVKNLINKDNTFSGVPKGRRGMRYAGIWQRNKKSIKMMVAYKDQRTVRPVYPATKIAMRHAHAVFPNLMNKYLNQALRTAR